MRLIDVLATVLITALTLLGDSAFPESAVTNATVAGMSTWKLPDSLSFCGERVPLEVEDVRERMEDVFYTRMVNDRANILFIKRSGKYFPFFDSMLTAMGMPADLKYLAAAESALRIDAVSRAGAGGLWQFIPETARLWGLTVNKDIDERFHVEKSTRAALRLLKSLRERYGSWSFAAAAYNAGQGTISEAMEKQKVDNYFDAFLNRETRYYLFHILFFKELFQRSEYYGFHVDSTEMHSRYDLNTQRISVKGPLRDLGHWASARGINYKTLKLLNFWILNYSLPAGEYELLLPANAVAKDTVHTVEDPVEIQHTVRPGDYLIKIAEQYGIGVNDIRSWNRLTSDVVPLGSVLRIYVPAHRRIVHQVAPGDNLTKIAEKYRVTVQQLLDWNRLTDDVVKLGADLVIVVGNEESYRTSR